jgi:hypothetical protein
MTVGKAIYYLLSNYTDLTDIVSTRIFPEVAEQDSALPFVIYSVISNEPSDTHEGPSKLDIAQVDVVLYNTDYSELVDMGVYVRAALDRVTGTYNGVGVQSVQYTSEIIDFEDYSRAYVLTQSYDVRINRDGFEIAQGTPVTGANIIDLADTPSTYGTTGQALVMNAEGDALEWGDAASALGSLTDVNLDDPQDHEALVYDQDTATWINGASTKIGIRVINTGFQLPKGTPVRATGVQGDQVIVAAFNASQHDPKTFVGMLSETLGTGATGYARQTGAIYGLNTSPFEIGDILYPKDTPVLSLLNGMDYMTTSVPETPGAKIACAIVLRKHENTGRVYVRTWTPSRKLEDLDDVNPLILPQFREGKSLVWNINRWIAGSPKLNMSELLDVQTYNPITIPNKQTLRWSSTALEWQVIPEVGGLPTTPNVITYFLGRYNDEASTARQAADATLTIEHYLSVQADGHGEELTQQTDTPTSGNKIVRKIWHKAVSFEDSDVSTWTLVHTFADDTAYADTTATFDALLTAATYGSIPFSLAQTWEEAAAFTGLLDTYSGAAAAYSLRLLDSTYTGDAIRVRRASDNTEQDIGFTDNELDTSALATFCAGTNGFVKTWYDQSGNANDATQTTTADQWKIYDASTGVSTRSGSVTIERGSSVNILAAVNLGTIAQPIDFFAVQAVQAGTSSARAWRTSSSSINVLIREFENDILLTAGAALISSVISPAPDNGELRLLNGLINSTSSEIYFDGAQVASGDAGTGTINANVHIGGLATAQLVDSFTEFIIYPSDQSANRAGIETNINDHYSIY